MSRPGDVEDPTREYPNYEPGRAQPGAPVSESLPEPEPAPVATGRNGAFRRLLWLGGVVAVLVALLVGARTLNLLPGFDNPFSDKTTDRSQPVLLQSMRDLSRYVAADGSFQVIVDLQENRENIPDFLVNRRTLFVGSGTVEQYVEFGGLADKALQVDNAAKTVQLTLPPPQQSPAALDLAKSYVVSEQRGVLTQIGDAFQNNPNQQQKVYQLAQQKITEAARASGLDQRAKENTQRMLESLFTRLGYTSVTVTFDSP